MLYKFSDGVSDIRPQKYSHVAKKKKKDDARRTKEDDHNVVDSDHCIFSTITNKAHQD